MLTSTTLDSSVASLKSSVGIEEAERDPLPIEKETAVPWKPKELCIHLCRLTEEEMEERTGKKYPPIYYSEESLKQKMKEAQEAALLQKLAETTKKSPRKEPGLIAEIEKTAKAKTQSKGQWRRAGVPTPSLSLRDVQHPGPPDEDDGQLYNISRAPAVKRKKKFEIVNVQKLIRVS